MAGRKQPRAYRLLMIRVCFCALIGGAAQADPALGPTSVGNWNFAVTVAGGRGDGVDETKTAASDD